MRTSQQAFCSALALFPFGLLAARGRSPDRSGRLAQLVEHLVYTERVGGSSPSAPTSFWNQRMSGGYSPENSRAQAKGHALVPYDPDPESRNVRGTFSRKLPSASGGAFGTTCFPPAQSDCRTGPGCLSGADRAVRYRRARQFRPRAIGRKKQADRPPPAQDEPFAWGESRGLRQDATAPRPLQTSTRPALPAVGAWALRSDPEPRNRIRAQPLRHQAAWQAGRGQSSGSWHDSHRASASSAAVSALPQSRGPMKRQTSCPAES